MKKIFLIIIISTLFVLNCTAQNVNISQVRHLQDSLLAKLNTARLGNIIADSLARIDNLLANIANYGFVTPEMYDAVGNNVINDLTPFNNMVNNVGDSPTPSAGSDQQYFITNQYYIDGQLIIDLGGANLTLAGNEGSLIRSSYVGVGSYYIPDGGVVIKNGKDVIISNIAFESTQGVLSLIDGLVIEDCKNVTLYKVSSKYANACGVRIVGADQVTLIDCDADSNLYAGAMFVSAKHITVVGGSYSYNGDTPYLNGYGITVSHPFGDFIQNENVSITGIKAYYNLRKGIDSHGGIGQSFIGNHIKGFTYAGIDAVGGDGGTLSDLNDVRDIIIDGNTIEGDSTWTTNLDYSAYIGAYSWEAVGGRAIIVGVIEDSSLFHVPIGMGSYKITNNIIKNLIWYDADSSMYKSLSAIRAFVGEYKSLEIYNNTIVDSKLENDVFGVYTGNEYGQPDVVKISGNIVDNCSEIKNGVIVITAGKTINIDHNIFTNIKPSTDTTDFAVEIARDRISDIRNIQIDHNTFDGVYHYGTYVSIYDQTKDYSDGMLPVASITNNIFSGSFSNDKIYTSDATIGMNINNNISRTPVTNADALLPGNKSYRMLNKYSNGSGDGQFVVMPSVTGNKIIRLLKVPNTYPSGNFVADITVLVTSDGSIRSASSVEYTFSAMAHCDINSISSFDIDTLSYTIFRGDSTDMANFFPTLSWTTTDDIGILYIGCPATLSSYNVAIKFSSFNMTIFD